MSKCYVFFKDIDTSQVAGDNKREAWFPKTGDGYFDASARRYFSTKRQKRAWLTQHKMRETGSLYTKRSAEQVKEAPRHLIEGTGGAMNRLWRESQAMAKAGQIGKGHPDR